VSGPLITVEELQALSPQPVILDIRYRTLGPSGHGEYLKGHIPGAAYVDLDAALAGPPGAGGRHPLPDPDVFSEAMRAAGVGIEGTVVVYDDWAGHAAARAWWLLRYYGHQDVRVLDGGWAAWVAAGGEVSTDDVVPSRGDFHGRPGSMKVVDDDGVTRVAVLVDARSPERHRGESEPIDPVAGRIPGSVNVFSGRNLDNHGHFRDPHELREVYAEVGAVPGADVATYCGSGVTAAHNVLAMEAIGIEAALYAGSWSSWITDPSRPVETG
jgi:thiosulfate/3-mercaptopyruvate sulfurtransferase